LTGYDTANMTIYELREATGQPYKKIHNALNNYGLPFKRLGPRGRPLEDSK